MFFLNLVQSQEIDVLGYLPVYRFDEIANIDLSMVTHVDIAFANPDKNGYIKSSDNRIKKVVRSIKKKGIIVYISLGGAGVTGQIAENWKNNMSASKRSKLIMHIKDYCLSNGFEGVDMDLEWDNVNNLYSPFVLQLRDTLDKYNLGLTAALPGKFRYPDLSGKALKAFDVINLMAYDFRGPWTPDNPGQHSSYEDAAGSVIYWKNQGLPVSKMRLGVPFYGYDFTQIQNIKSFRYSDMVIENTDYAYLDKVGERYYNGINTIKKKTRYVKSQNLKGIMIWELGQDAFIPYESYSLLKAINDIRTAGNKNIASDKGLYICPNPFENTVTVCNENSEMRDDLKLIISDINGRIVYNSTVDCRSIDLASIANGMYFYTLIDTGKVYRGKIVKQ